MWLDLVEATGIAFEEEGLASNERDMVKWSGTLADRLWIGWNFAAAGESNRGQYRLTADPNNPCMIWVLYKIGINRKPEVALISQVRSKNCPL